MSEQKGIYWLASYPKSGNTWMRSFIQGMLKLQGLIDRYSEQGGDGNELPLTEHGLIDINAMHTGFIASGRVMIQQILGFNLSDLSQDEVDKLRPKAYSWYGQKLDNNQYNKIHDANVILPNGEPLIPADSCKGVLYIVRNPFDVAISFANHNGTTLNRSIMYMGYEQFALAASNTGINNQFRQYLYSWSKHVESWINATHLNVKCVRYEDMKQNPTLTFLEIAKYLHLSNDKRQVETVLQEIKIEKLQKQEKDKGFAEKSAAAKSFFRKGVVGDWEQTLNQQQIDRITADHKHVMRRLGYLDENCQPTDLIRFKN